MREPQLPEVRNLARRLLESQTTGTSEVPSVAEAERVLVAIADDLKPLVGLGGYHLLLVRALKRAQLRHPALARVEVRRDAEKMVHGLDAAACAVGAEEFVDAVQALIAELIGLIARFLGADLAIRLIRGAFSELYQEERNESVRKEPR
jgi:hypothetical protein